MLALPEDVLAEAPTSPDASPGRPAQPQPGGAELERVRELLAAAERPLVVVGGSRLDAEAAGDGAPRFCEAGGLPVARVLAGQDYVDNDAPCYAGHLGLGVDPALRERLRDADLLLVVGARLGDIETGGFAMIAPPGVGRTLVHVHPDPDELGRVYEPALGIVSVGRPLRRGARGARAAAARRGARRGRARRLPRDARRPAAPGRRRPDAGDGDPPRPARPDAILTSGAGNFTVWAHRFYVFRSYRTQLAPLSGAMGYGVPAAIAAKLVHPERDVVCLAGDGDFLMSASELATARQAEAPIVVLVVDNGMYGTIRMHQERRFPGRVSGTDLLNPDFAALAEAFGCHAERVERTDDGPGRARPGARGRPAGGARSSWSIPRR